MLLFCPTKSPTSSVSGKSQPLFGWEECCLFGSSARLIAICRDIVHLNHVNRNEEWLFGSARFIAISRGIIAGKSTLLFSGLFKFTTASESR